MSEHTTCTVFQWGADKKTNVIFVQCFIWEGGGGGGRQMCILVLCFIWEGVEEDKCASLYSVSFGKGGRRQMCFFVLCFIWEGGKKTNVLRCTVFIWVGGIRQRIVGSGSLLSGTFNCITLSGRAQPIVGGPAYSGRPSL